MIMDEDLDYQLQNFEKKNLGLSEQILQIDKNANPVIFFRKKKKNKKTEKKTLKLKRDESHGINSTTKSLNTANFSGTSIHF